MVKITALRKRQLKIIKESFQVKKEIEKLYYKIFNKEVG